MSHNKSLQNIIASNISLLMKYKNIDATVLSNATGLPSSTISRLRSTKTESAPNLLSLMPIANYFNISISQLIGEEKLYSDNKCPLNTIPFLNSETINAFLNSHSIAFEVVSVDIDVGKHSFAYYLRGSAMEPQFPDKSLLIIDPSIEYEHLDYVLFMPKDKNSPILRQILLEGDDMYLRTLNPSFNEFIKFSEVQFKILGVMIQVRKNYKDLDAGQNLQAHLKSI